IRLTTVEAAEPQISMSSKRLKELFGDSIMCHFGRTETILPELAKSVGQIDFMFHDAGHSHDDYVRDFGSVVGSLSPGSVILIDDIRWNDPRYAQFSGHQSDTYRGWQHVVAHTRIRHAIEANESM